MNVKRNLRLSVRKEVETQLIAMGYTNIYGESTMRAKTTPTRPYCFLMDSFVRPMETTLPFVIIEMRNLTRQPFEIGNRTGHESKVFLHIFGRTRGDRDDIASYLQDNIPDAFQYYDFTTGSSGSAVTGTMITLSDKSDIEDVPGIPDEVITESSLSNWNMLSFETSLKI